MTSVGNLEAALGEPVDPRLAALYASSSYQAVAQRFLALLDNESFAAAIDAIGLDDVSSSTAAPLSFPPNIFGKVAKAIGYGLAILGTGAAMLGGAITCGATVVCVVAVVGGGVGIMIGTTLVAANDFKGEIERDASSLLKWLIPNGYCVIPNYPCPPPASVPAADSPIVPLPGEIHAHAAA